MKPLLQILELRRLATLFRKQEKFKSAEEIDRQIVDYVMKYDGNPGVLAVAFFELAESLVGQGKHLEAHFYYDRAAAIWEQAEPPADAGRKSYNQTLDSIAIVSNSLEMLEPDQQEQDTA